MPLIYVHGVNVREKDDYNASLHDLKRRFESYVWSELSATNPHFSTVTFADPQPYWGQHGAQPSLQTVPEGQTYALQNMSPEVNAALGADEVNDAEVFWLSYLSQFKHLPKDNPGKSAIESMSPAAPAPLKSAITAECAGVLESLRITLEDVSDLATQGGKQHWLGLETTQRHLLFQAIEEMSIRDSAHLCERLAAAENDRAAIEVLAVAISKRYQELSSRQTGETQTDEIQRGAVEDQAPGRRDGLTDRLKDLLATWMGKDLRKASQQVLVLFRRAAHEKMQRFLGDVFVYLAHRGTREKPGEIIREISDCIDRALTNHPDEPLVLLTHSMGGNIVYDLLTYFRPDLHADVWISVASQVGQFQEMSLFARHGRGRENSISCKTVAKCMGSGRCAQLQSGAGLQHRS